MTAPVLNIAVVGHTNTGKTSLLRTLMRDAVFGDVSSRPATTRIVESSTLYVDGAPAIQLIDTPGLENSSELHDRLDDLKRARRCDWTDAILHFLDDPEARDGFQQEAKALRQVIECDVALYLIDARDRVMGKHRDELDILGRCARPVVPVLNFVADASARSDEWRVELARVNMHVVAYFDTVVFDELGELALFQKLRHMLEPYDKTLDAVIEETKRAREGLRRSSADLIAELVIDVAAYTVAVPMRDRSDSSEALPAIRHGVRVREQAGVDALLGLFRFAPGDYLSETLPIADGKWGLDLFSPASLVEFGLATGEAAATGALAGLAVDAMTVGLTLGSGAATGAVVGALVGAAQSRGRKILDVLRGHTNLRVEDATLDVLAMRQLTLVRALLRRGHASQDRIRLELDESESDDRAVLKRIRPLVNEARRRPEWSRMEQPRSRLTDGRRDTVKDRLAKILADALMPPETTNGSAGG